MDNSIRKNIEAIQDGATKKGTFNFKDVHVFTMPRGFKKSSIKSGSEADSAKKTGFIILIFGSLFLVLALLASYYFFVMKPSSLGTVTPNDAGKEIQVPAVNTEKAEQEKNKKEPIRQVEAGKNLTGETEQVDSNIPEEPEDIANDKNKDPNSQVEQGNENNQDEEVVKEKPIIVNIVDNDKDGLSREEEIVAGTSDSSPDTDSDTYTDLAEMLNGYNPLGDGNLADNANFIKFENTKYNFSFYYPKTFLISANTDDVTIIDLGGEEFFQLFVEANEKKLSMEDWYKSQFGVDFIDPNLISTKGAWESIKNANSKSIFFKNVNADYVIAFNYSSNSGNRYLNIFEIAFNSFTILN